MMKKISIIRLFFTVLSILLLRYYVIQPFRTTGISMEPTYRNGSIIFVNKLVYRIRKPERGEIVVFRTNDAPYLYFVKRILGLAGEEIEINNGKLLVNGMQVEEGYLPAQNSWDIPPFDVREGCVFVAGDNREMPVEAHIFTQVALRNIVGMAMGGR